MTTTRSKYAANTKVSEEKSREEIDKLLKKYGAGQRVYGYDDEHNLYRIQFSMQGRKLRFDLPVPSLNEFATVRAGVRGTVARPEAQATLRWEQACRTRWRALALVIKGKLESVETGIEVFDEAFLAHIIVEELGSTVGDWMLPQVREIYEHGGLPGALPGLQEPPQRFQLPEPEDTDAGA